MANVLIFHYYLLFPSRIPFLCPQGCSNFPRSTRKPCLDSVFPTAIARRLQRLSHLKVHAVVAANDGTKWWEKIDAGLNVIVLIQHKSFWMR
ncbi:putative thioredoxin-like 2, chloroplastic [Cocos nucifera]|uniref:Putative thioredoxin-like 2, chloroplastic n=1 Tax=Cocos nucifera TaxID=13894 RepID=A0A8K0HXR0_COCNU|nr:putative thioredoxin-like 2, chloroplastic [Cocos nucifera]